jgi:hypothetical protein
MKIINSEHFREKKKVPESQGFNISLRLGDTVMTQTLKKTSLLALLWLRAGIFQTTTLHLISQPLYKHQPDDLVRADMRDKNRPIWHTLGS